MKPSDIESIQDVQRWLRHYVEWSSEASRDMMLAACRALSGTKGDHLDLATDRIDALEAELAEAKAQTERDENALRMMREAASSLSQREKMALAERDAAVAKLEKSVKREEVRTRVDTEKMVRMAARLTRLEKVAEKARDWLLQLPSPLDERPYRKSVVDALRALDPGKEE